MNAPTLQIQSILYKTPRPSVDRFLSSVARAAALAKQSSSVSEVTMVVGDCSPLRTFTTEAAEEAEKSLATAGLDRLHYEFFDANLGSAAGHNRLLSKFETDLVLILNPDIVASPYLIDELMLRVLQPGIGLVEGRQLPIEHPKFYDPVTGETSWATTACAMIPRKVVREVGGFDSDFFFLYCDDVDYSWRIRLAGYKIIFHPPARLFHDKRLDAHGRMVIGPAEEYYAAEAALFLTYKWSRPDLTEIFAERLEKGGSDLHRKAVAEFRARQMSKTLPQQLDADHRVGQFDDAGNWARHRW